MNLTRFIPVNTAQVSAPALVDKPAPKNDDWRSTTKSNSATAKNWPKGNVANNNIRKAWKTIESLAHARAKFPLNRDEMGPAVADAIFNNTELATDAKLLVEYDPSLRNLMLRAGWTLGNELNEFNGFRRPGSSAEVDLPHLDDVDSAVVDCLNRGRSDLPSKDKYDLAS